MQKKYFVFIIFILLKINLYSYSNYIIVSVGNDPITYYDVITYRDFLIYYSGGQRTNTFNESLDSLIYGYALINEMKKYSSSKSLTREIDRFISDMTKSTSQDQISQIRKFLYDKYPDHFRFELLKAQAIKTLLYYDQNLKDKANINITEDRIKKYYETNKNSFLDMPVYIFLVIGVIEPTNSSEIRNFENNLEKLRNDLAITNDLSFLMNRYDKINFTTFSGITEDVSPHELDKNKYPQEVINLINKYSFYMTNENYRVGTIIGPERIIQRNNTVRVYLKLLEVKPQKVLPYEKVRNFIVEKLREEYILKETENYIKNKINNNEIAVNYRRIIN